MKRHVSLAVVILFPMLLLSATEAWGQIAKTSVSVKSAGYPDEIGLTKIQGASQITFNFPADHSLQATAKAEKILDQVLSKYGFHRIALDPQGTIERTLIKLHTYAEGNKHFYIAKPIGNSSPLRFITLGSSRTFGPLEGHVENIELLIGLRCGWEDGRGVGKAILNIAIIGGFNYGQFTTGTSVKLRSQGASPIEVSLVPQANIYPDRLYSQIEKDLDLAFKAIGGSAESEATASARRQEAIKQREMDRLAKLAADEEAHHQQVLAEKEHARLESEAKEAKRLAILAESEAIGARPVRLPALVDGELIQDGLIFVWRFDPDGPFDCKVEGKGFLKGRYVDASVGGVDAKKGEVYSLSGEKRFTAIAWKYSDKKRTYEPTPINYSGKYDENRHEVRRNSNLGYARITYYNNVPWGQLADWAALNQGSSRGRIHIVSIEDAQSGAEFADVELDFYDHKERWKRVMPGLWIHLSK